MQTFIPKNKFADWLQYWATNQEIPIWTSAELLPNPTYDSTTGKWMLKIVRNGKDEVILQPKHLIMATGLASSPDMPPTPGSENFKGTILHSHSFKSASAWGGKNVVVVGAVSSRSFSTVGHWIHINFQGVSGMDVALEADARGANATIIQRSPMYVLYL